MPNVALIESFRKEGWCCIYAGSAGGMEKRILEDMGVPFFAVPSGKLRRYFSWQNFVDPFLVLLGVFRCIALCARESPDVIFSKGGFVAVPVVLAGWILRIPVVSHESDVTPGLANRLCFPFSRTICINFEESRQYLPQDKVVLTGTPLRENLTGGDAESGRNLLGLTGPAPVLLVFGGSLGARVLNEQLRRVIDSLLPEFHIVHVTGAGQIDTSLRDVPGYVQREFLGREFGDVLAASDIVVSRAGANALYELLVMRKPHILIPLSRRVSRGDQLVNARTFARAGYSHLVEEEDLSDQTFLAAIREVYAHRREITGRLADFPVLDSTAIIRNLLVTLQR